MFINRKATYNIFTYRLYQTILKFLVFKTRNIVDIEFWSSKIRTGKCVQNKIII